MRTFDLRSDTVSPQTPEMRAALGSLAVGDDVFGEDESTAALEAHAAALFGKEAALLVPSGTMGNLISVLTHARRGAEVVLGDKSHIFDYERGGVSALGGAAFHTVSDDGGIPTPDAIRAAIRGGEIYHAPTGLICIENTHNARGGIAVPIEKVERVGALAREQGIPVHLDGARIFNACARLGTAPAAFAAQVDSLMFCLTKGLGAPVGAVIVGSAEFVARARQLRKMLGGGMRQTGYIARLGLFGLQEWERRSHNDNESAQKFIEAMSGFDRFEPLLDPHMTNIVYFKIKGLESASDRLPELARAGVKLLANTIGFRAVFHNGVPQEDVGVLADRMLTCFEPG